MTRARLFGALFALVLLAGCNDAGLPPGGTYSKMQGTVVDALTHKPIAGATVVLETVLQTTTHDDGTFSFAQVPVGQIDYEIKADGYKTYSSSATVDPSKPLVVNVTLSH